MWPVDPYAAMQLSTASIRLALRAIGSRTFPLSGIETYTEYRFTRALGIRCPSNASIGLREPELLQGRGRRLPEADQFRQFGIAILPDEEHGPLRGPQVVRDVRGHRAAVAGLHVHVGPQVPRVPVPDLHRDLAVQEEEPFHAIVAVRDRQDVLLRRRAEQAVLHRGHDLRVPRDVI